MEESTSTTGLRRERPETSGATPLVIAAGGAIGAIARYGMAVWFPNAGGSFPWATFCTNIAGCLAIGVLVVLLTEVASAPHRLLRPFLGVGILGGFTTFSTFSVDIHQLLRADAAIVALTYMGGTVMAALLAVELGIAVTRRAVRS